MRVFNGTEHEINLYRLDQCDQANPRKLIVKQGEKPCFTVPPGVNLNAQKSNKPAPKGDFPFPVSGAVTFTGHDPLPEDYDVYIVSNLYRSAVKELGGDTSKLGTINGAVYGDKDNPRPCGCLEIAIG
jgi:hypothetical protein